MAWKPKFDWHPSPRRPRCPSTISSSSAFSSRLTSFSSDAGDSFVSAEDCFEEDELGVLRKFPLWALQVATDYFSQKNQLGRGYFGIVYKGQLADGSLVAVRRLKDLFLGPESQFQTELNVFNLSLHKNLLILQGFCMTPTERLLVYPYMANRSLAHQLRGRSISENPLDWPTRRRIALGSARGLSYLHDHCGPKFLYNGINATNILLDEEFEAVVDGYPAAVRGSIYHIAPEYQSTGRYSEKTDVFSYGIMLLELITGKRIFDLRRLANDDDDESLLDWMIGLLEEKRLDMLVDPELQDNYIEAEVEFTVQLAILCSQGSQMGRPKMSEVVRILEGEDLTERWEEWKKANERGLDLEFGTYRIWKSDSTENLDSMELSSPR